MRAINLTPKTPKKKIIEQLEEKNSDLKEQNSKLESDLRHIEYIMEVQSDQANECSAYKTLYEVSLSRIKKLEERLEGYN